MSLAFYCELCLQYTTAVMFAVTCVTLLYIVVCVGHVEGLNMMEVHRVAGIVWVGRPLLSLRSLVAVLLLATSTLELEQFGTVTKLAENAKTDWIATPLSGSETCWLIIVKTDVGMAVTKDLTSKYSLYSTVIATVAATLISVVSPVQPKYVFQRTCSSPQVNFQVECTAGVVQIGSFRRVIELIVLTSGVVVLCYLWERWRHPHFKLPQHNTSLLLPAGAVYLYNKGPWIFHGTLYLDKASAFMCGLIAVSYKRSIYELDVKTWRLHVIAIDDGLYPHHLSIVTFYQALIAAAVPLID